MRRVAIAVGLATFVLCSPVPTEAQSTLPVAKSSPSLTPRQSEILHIVVSADGFVTEGLHREFWSAMPVEARSAAKSAEYRRLLSDLLGASMKYQQQFWLSMQATLKAGRIVKTPGYEDAKRRNLAVSAATGNQASQGAENGEQMLAAAAEGRPFPGPKGLIYMTPEMVDQVLAGLDGSLARLNQLADPIWRETATEHRYPDAHVAIISPSPFALERQNSVDEAGNHVQILALSRRLDKSSYYYVSFAHYDAPWTDPATAVIRGVRGSLRGLGASTPNVFASTWRSRISATGDGEAETSEGPLFVSVRLVELRELQGALIFVVVSDTSKADADEMLDQLESATQLLL